MKKTSKILMLMVIAVVIFPGSVFAQTIDQVQQEKQQLEQQRQEALNQLRAQELSLKDILNKVAEAHSQQETLNNEKAAIEGSIATTNIEIETKQQEIDNIKEKAGASLVFYQRVNVTNPLIDQIFQDDFGSEEFEEQEATNKILDAGVTSINEAIELQKQLNEKKAQLEQQKAELDVKVAEIDAKTQELEILRDKVQAQRSEAESNYNSAQAGVVAQQNLEQMMAAAGCQPGQVYGVDCGQMQSNGVFARPVSYGMVTEETQWNGGYSGHTGIDIGQNGSGGPIYSIGVGQVIAAGYNIVSGGGNQVLIVHNYNGQQVISSYCHMSSINVSKGQYVDASTQVGTIGQTGNAFGPHLHFELSSGDYGWNPGGSWINPRNMVNFPPKGVWFNGR